MRDDAAIGIRSGQIKAAQIRGAPDHPVQNLYPCHMTEGVVWKIDTGVMLSSGIMFQSDGTVSYAPAMVARMRIQSFRVWVHADAFDLSARYRLTLRYADQQEKVREQVTPTIDPGKVDRFAFDVPLDHLAMQGWFVCALVLEPLTPLNGDEKLEAVRAGFENPVHPILLRGAWLEVKG